MYQAILAPKQNLKKKERKKNLQKQQKSNKRDNEGLTSVPTIGDSADEDNHPRKLGSRDLTTLNFQNNLVC
jgi:hypothetical protein